MFMIINDPKRILRFKDVQKIIPLSRSHIYSLISNERFPAPVKLVAGGRGAGWWEHEIYEYLDGRYVESRGGNLNEEQ
jgi:predicted DNA-binding transcriptional regulator AlpA